MNLHNQQVVDKPIGRTLTYRHISKAADEIVSYIDSRRRGALKSVKTRWEKFNDQCMGGIEPNTIYTIAGRRHMPALNS